MDEGGQAELERRVLALLRDFVEGSREDYPAGFEIGDIVLVWEFIQAPADDETLQPWEHPRDPGFRRNVSFSSTSRSFWMMESMLAEALRRTRLHRDEDDGDEDDDEDVDEDESNARE